MAEQPDIDMLLDAALSLRLYLPVMIDTLYAPLVWVDPAQRQDLLELEQRSLAIGKQITRLSLLEILAVYGKRETGWIYHVGRDVVAYFLSIQIEDPPFTNSSLDISGQQVSFVLGFNVLQEATIALLQAIVKSKCLLLHFSAVPEWLLRMPPLSSGRSRHGGHEEELLDLVRSSIPVGFTAEAMATLQAQIYRLQSRR